MNNDIQLVDNLYIKNLIGTLTRTFFEKNEDPKWEKMTAVYNSDPGYFTANELRFQGAECWPLRADSMIGVYRMVNIYESLKDVIKKGIEGDFVETGVWKGGACVLANAIIHELGEESKRLVHVFDSFEGLPAPYMEQDNGDRHYTLTCLAIDLDTVKGVFEKYGYLTENVKFRKGFFKDTMLHTEDIEKIAVLRLDGDMYSSTIEVLDALYDKVQPGGVVIVDDWALPGARKAVYDFLAKRNYNPDIVRIDNIACYWRK
jgi:O-methyltransferase